MYVSPHPRAIKSCLRDGSNHLSFFSLTTLLRGRELLCFPRFYIVVIIIIEENHGNFAKGVLKYYKILLWRQSTKPERRSKREKGRSRSSRSSFVTRGGSQEEALAVSAIVWERETERLGCAQFPAEFSSCAEKVRLRKSSRGEFPLSPNKFPHDIILTQLIRR